MMKMMNDYNCDEEASLDGDCDDSSHEEYFEL